MICPKCKKSEMIDYPPFTPPLFHDGLVCQNCQHRITENELKADKTAMKKSLKALNTKRRKTKK